MALADILTPLTPRRPAAPVVRAFGQRPQVSGTGMTGLVEWVAEIAALTRPDRVHWVDGSAAENDMLLRGLVAEGKLISEIDFDAIAKAEDAKTRWQKHAASKSIFA